MKRKMMMMAVTAMLSAGAQAQSAIGWMDVDKDGKVTKEEFIEMRTKAAMKKGQAPGRKAISDLFKKMDADGDGVLTDEEVKSWDNRVVG
jgi:Ca2+-binding EF-hand superfamily protein